MSLCQFPIPIKLPESQASKCGTAAEQASAKAVAQASLPDGQLGNLAASHAGKHLLEQSLRHFRFPIVGRHQRRRCSHSADATRRELELKAEAAWLPFILVMAGPNQRGQPAEEGSSAARCR
jgi:hypothetical protein